MLKITLNPQRKKKKRNDKGMALIEAIPVLFMVILVFNFSLGFFGAVHSGILNSIASYNYTMETFRFRNNLIYFRPGGGTANYAKSMNRVHGVIGDGYAKRDMQRGRWPATVRSVVVSGVDKIEAQQNPDQVDHTYGNRNTTSVWKAIAGFTASSEQEAPATPEIWVKTVYGICLNADCEKASQ